MEYYVNQLQPQIEEKLQSSIKNNIDSYFPELAYILNYHMGWEGPAAGPSAQGKRIRPLLLLVCAIATGSDWKRFLPFAASVELLHNFSLIHDDIEDNSPLRRGRETIWQLWGIPQAINVGDLLFTIAHLSLLNETGLFSPHITINASRILHQTCVKLTQGQYLDMEFEKKDYVTLDEYWKMIAGKTAALISCCTQLGAIEAPPDIAFNFTEFGKSLGMAFQIQDDILGIWGNTSTTGKSNALDLINRKKTLPVLYALENNLEFTKCWQLFDINEEVAFELAMLLKHDGTFDYTKNLVDSFTQKAIQSLEATKLDNPALTALKEFALQLTSRLK